MGKEMVDLSYCKKVSSHVKICICCMYIKMDWNRLTRKPAPALLLEVSRSRSSR